MSGPREFTIQGLEKHETLSGEEEWRVIPASAEYPRWFHCIKVVDKESYNALKQENKVLTEKIQQLESLRSGDLLTSLGKC